MVQLEKYFDFSLYSHHFSLLSLTSLLSAPEREVTSPSDFKVVGALDQLMEHDIHLGCLGEDHVPWIDQSLHSPHGKSSIVYSYQMHETKLDVPGMPTY